MASQAQIDANRRNAQRSTGPRTAAGKAKVALNALAHGLTAAKVVAGEEDGPLFEGLRRQLQREWRPGSILEVMAVDRMAELVWQLRRVAGVEAGVIEKMPKWRPAGVKAENYSMAEAMAKDFAKPNPTLMRVQMYQGRLERALHRTLAELRRMQIERQMQDERDEIEENEADANPVPLLGERLGEGMRSQSTLGAAENVTESAESVSTTSPAATSSRPASPQGEGPEAAQRSAVLPVNEVDKTNPISPATPGPAIGSADAVPAADGAQTSDKRGSALRCPHGSAGYPRSVPPMMNLVTETA